MYYLYIKQSARWVLLFSSDKPGKREVFNEGIRNMHAYSLVDVMVSESFFVLCVVVY